MKLHQVWGKIERDINQLKASVGYKSNGCHNAGDNWERDLFSTRCPLRVSEVLILC